MTESSNRIGYQVRDGIAERQLRRLAKKNALELGMYDEISDAIGRAAGDAQVRCLLLSGAEGAFCAGNDIDVVLDEHADILCEPAGGREMKEMGLVNEVVTGAALYEHALVKARRLAGMPADAPHTVRDMMRRGAVEPVPDLFHYEMTQVVRLMRSDEASRWCAAFLARRKAS